MPLEYSVQQLDGLEAIPAEDWDRLTDGCNPFVRYHYLCGLEKHDCLKEHGWIPCHLTVYSGQELVGALPLYLRSNSYGEFVFDWAWAEAYERAGGQYYPKLVSAIPFAPVTGPRLLVLEGAQEPDKIRRILIDAAIQFATDNGLSSWHSLFVADDEHDNFINAGLLTRKTSQFHWYNREYQNFDDFLSTLKSKKRKQIKRERSEVSRRGIQIEVLNGHEITDSQWQSYYNFYCSTFFRRWGSPRLTLDFFRHLGETMPDETLLVLATDQGEYVAGAFIMAGGETLYGRHWGASDQYPFLHFEICYYQTIEYCINQRYKKIDAGVQGEHKLSRGFHPVLATSFHWIENPALRKAVNDFVQMEARELNHYTEVLRGHLPFKLTENNGNDQDNTQPDKQ